jgi:hypothetical protein
MGDPIADHVDVRDDLKRLLMKVQRTRAAELKARRLGRADASFMLPARRASLRALEAYVAALDRQGWPAPPKLRQDIRLLRALCGERHASGW